jgi:hypothetical protein
MTRPDRNPAAELGGKARSRPVTDPLRVMVIDPATAARVALCRAIDMETDLAVLCAAGDPRHAAADIARCAIDVVVLALNPDDPRAEALCSALLPGGHAPALLVTGASAPSGAPASPAYHRQVIAAIRARGRGAGAGGPMPEVVAITAAEARPARLH